MIKISDIYKVYKNGTIANRNLSFNISSGEILGIIGSNGAGKTTLVRQIVGLSRPTSGKIEIDDINFINRRKDYMHCIAFSNQNVVLLEAQTAFEVVYFAGIFRGLNRKDSKHQTDELLEYFGINTERGKRLANLSGGQKKLVLLAAAFVGHCPIIVLDEPTNDLDPINRSRLWDIVRCYNDRLKVTFIIVSHNLSELENVARKVIIMRGGSIVDQGDLQMLKGKYNSGYQISLKCKYEDLHKLLQNINFPYEIENQNEVIVRIEEDDLLHVSQNMLPMVQKFGVELKIFRASLMDIYQTIQEEK